VTSRKSTSTDDDHDHDHDHAATLTFTYDTDSRARIVERSVAREVAALADDRSRATLDRDGTHVTITIAARDLTALRAATTTWTTLVDVAERAAAVGTDAS
jgi:KEOPS complex subunit Pcc1